MKRARAAIAAMLTLAAPGLTAEAGSTWKPRQKAKPAETADVGAAAATESGEQKVLEQFLDEGPFDDASGDDAGNDLLSDLDTPATRRSKRRFDHVKAELPLEAAGPAARASRGGSKTDGRGRKSVEVQLGADDQSFLEARAARQRNAASAASKPQRTPAAARVATTPGASTPVAATSAGAAGESVSDVAAAFEDGDAQKSSRRKAAPAPQAATYKAQSEEPTPAVTSAGLATDAPPAGGKRKRAGASAPVNASFAAAGAAAGASVPQADESPEAAVAEPLFADDTAAAPGGKRRRAPRGATAEYDDAAAAQGADKDMTGDALAGMLSDAPAAGPNDDDELLAEAAANGKTRLAPKAASARQYAMGGAGLEKGRRTTKVAAVGNEPLGEKTRGRTRSQQNADTVATAASTTGSRGVARAGRHKGDDRAAVAAATTKSLATGPVNGAAKVAAATSGPAVGSAKTAAKIAAGTSGPAVGSAKTAAQIATVTNRPTIDKPRAEAGGLDAESSSARAAGSPAAATSAGNGKTGNASTRAIALAAQDAAQPVGAALGKAESLAARGGVSPMLIAALVMVGLLAGSAGTFLWRHATKRARPAEDQDEFTSLA